VRNIMGRVDFQPARQVHQRAIVVVRQCSN
jgi:hypothetical protein